jgi:ABC-2 type transport system permease protein
MSALASEHPIPAPRLGALVRSEALRARSRRSLRWMVLLAVLAVLGVSALMWFSTGRVTQVELDAAAQRFAAEQQLNYEQCVADPSIPDDQRADFCWKPSPEEAAQNALWSVDRRPFDQDGFEGLIHFTGAIGALVCLLLAATTGGADWGARTMGLVLSWEPRRTRVFGVRILVVVIMALIIEVALLAIAIALGSLVAQGHALDVTAGPSLGDWPQPADRGAALALAVRWLPLAGLASVGSFAVAMLTRSTGWAIGALIGFVAVVESVVQGVWAWGSQWLIQTNIAAWLSGGITWVVDRTAAQRGTAAYSEGAGGDQVVVGPGAILITDTRGLATLVALALAAAVASWLSFRRRDVE